MKRNILFALAIFSILFACNTQQDTAEDGIHKIDPSIAAIVDSIGQSFLENGGVMGLSIAIAKEGEVIYNQGFGYIDPQQSQPVKSENYFLMASISKLVGAAMIMKLVEEKKLSLDDYLIDLLPDYPNKEHGKKIRLRHLLSHTSGLKDYATVIDSVYMATDVDPTVADYYEFFNTHELDFDPGTHYNYSNSGYLLVAMIVEKVTGKEFREELDRIVNQPTGLSLKLIAERVKDKRTTALFEVKDTTITNTPHWTWIKGDGGITATASELALFPFFWSDGSIISEESYQEMCASTKLSDGVHTRYGLGVRTGDTAGERCIGHTGGNKSTMALMKFYPALKTSVVVMVNTDNSPADAQVIEGYVSLAVLQKQEPKLALIAIKDFDHTPYLGDYLSAPNMYYGEGGQSILKYKNDPYLYRKNTGTDSKGQKLYYLGDHTFGYDRFPLDRIIFEKDSSGQITAFNTYWNGLRKGRLFKKK